MQTFKIGIIGTGWIAEKMAITVQGMPKVEVYAVASREQARAEAFAKEYGVRCAYDSYLEMLEDENVELVYIASPHSHHYEHAKACILKNKPVLCEKAFTATAWQTEEILSLAKEKKVFITEAIWTRYMPLSQTVCDLLETGIIGRPQILSCNLGYPVWEKDRMQKAELAGGTLLDLGIYPINFASMVFGSDIKDIVSSCTKTESGMDAQNSMTFIYTDGRMAVLHSSMLAKTDRQAVVSGDKGHLIVQNCNNPERVLIVDDDYRVIARYDAPKQITGYEYQVYACIEALQNGWLESPYMPHAETLRIMRLMDELRKSWGVHYPWDK